MSKLHIYAENFRSYPLIDWELPNALTLIDGLNHDTRGSNLAGKTTLLDSWFWCRYGWLPKWDGPRGGEADAVIRRGTERCVVRVVEHFTQDIIEIQRERPSKLTVKKNGEVIRGLDQSGLDVLLGMNANQFLVSVYLKQKRRKSFYWMSDAERTDLLSTIANLEKLDEAFSSAKLQKDHTNSKVDTITAKLSILTTQLENLPTKLQTTKALRFERQLELGTAKETVFKRELDLSTYSKMLETALKAKIEAQENKYLDALTQSRLEFCELQGRLNGLNQSLRAIPEVEPELVVTKSKAERMLEQAKTANDRHHSDRRHLEHRISITKEHLANAQVGQCEHCKQFLPESERAPTVFKLSSEINSLEAQVAEINKQYVDLAPFKKASEDAYTALFQRSAELSVLPTSIKKDIYALEIQVNQKRNEAKTLEQSFEMFKRERELEFQKDLQTLKNEVTQAKTQLERLNASYELAQETYQGLLVEQELMTKSVQGYEISLVEAQNQLNEALDLLDLFGPKGFRAVCYDGLVARISERASQLLGVMTENIYSSRIDQVGADSKGQQKLILKPIILKNGNEVPSDDLSGGAETRVALAYDVAISEAIGQNLPLLLDETLEGLDAVGKSEAMALLEEISKTRSVLVIDHASEFKAMFNQVVRVIYQGGESRLEAQ